jgi:hypothetical protein
MTDPDVPDAAEVPEAGDPEPGAEPVLLLPDEHPASATTAATRETARGALKRAGRAARPVR